MNKRILLPVAAAALAAGVAAGCGGSGGGSAATPVGNGTQLALPAATTQSQSGLTQAQLTSSTSSTLQAVGDPYELIPALVEQVQPSVVSVLVQTQQGGGQGSGVVWDGSRGIIVTNNHVVEGATQAEVQLSGGERLPAQVLATDPVTDLAVIQVDRTDLPSATFAQDLPRVGELAVALGNPLGFENTVTAGIVSALHRSLGEDPFVDLVQTDAPISPGNSGGALVNRDGEVIGINSAGIPTTENANSLGFAIPSPTVISVVDQLLADGTASHAFLGVSSQDTADGIAVESVGEGTAAAAAGLQAGDVIVAIDGTPVTTTTELVSALRAREPGDTVTLTVVRSGASLDVQVTLGERTAPAA